MPELPKHLLQQKSEGRAIHLVQRGNSEVHKTKSGSLISLSTEAVSCEPQFIISITFVPTSWCHY